MKRNSMKKLYFVRHGETESNVGGLVQDGSAQLSERGVKQTEFIASRFEHLSFDNFFTSDYVRAADTAKAIAKTTGKTPVVNTLLREMKRPSEYVGMSSDSDIYQEYLKETDKNIEDPSWHHSDEENFHDVLKRVEEFLTQVEEMKGDVLAVSHGRFIRMTVLHIITNRQLTPLFWRQSMNGLVPTNTGITVFEYRNDNKKWQLRTFNDFAHFAE